MVSAIILPLALLTAVVVISVFMITLLHLYEIDDLAEEQYVPPNDMKTAVRPSAGKDSIA